MNSIEMLGGLPSEIKITLFSKKALQLCLPPARTDRHQPPGLRLFFKRCHQLCGKVDSGDAVAAMKLQSLKIEIEKTAEKFTELEKNLARYEFCGAHGGTPGVELFLAAPEEIGYQTLLLLTRFDELCIAAEAHLAANQAQQLIRSGKRQLRRLFSYQL